MKNSNTIIVGAGRLGGTIARSLNKTANVIVIDRNASKIDRLGEYSGFVEKGEATDRALLEKCGVRNCYRFIAVTDDDMVSFFQERHQVFAGALHIFQLFGEGAFLACAQQRIAPEGNHRQLAHRLSKTSRMIPQASRSCCSLITSGGAKRMM